ncbi:hypothetical protein Trydic_g8770 [Trypoxylus dichotomus]
MNNITSNTSAYCHLEDFHKTYREMHGYFSIFVCIFGSVTNVLNICVLTTKEMRWPTNFILTGLAVADLLVMLDYIPFAIHNYFDPLSRLTASYFIYPWAVYMFFHALASQVCHFISCCLTLILAVWRYIAITHPQNNKTWCSAERTKIAIILTYVVCPIMCFPLYLSLHIRSASRMVYDNGTLIQIKDIEQQKINYSNGYDNETIYYVDYTSDSIYPKISFWVYGVVIKLFPCILLTILSKQLISALIAAQKRRYNLLSNKGVPMEKINGKASAASQRLLEQEQQTDRTTRMLLAVLLLFLITEFPQAILGLLSATIGEKFDKECHRPLGDFLDILALTNSAINFILYCSMSCHFRTAIAKLFQRTIMDRLRPKNTLQKNEDAKEAITAVTNV